SSTTLPGLLPVLGGAIADMSRSFPSSRMTSMATILPVTPSSQPGYWVKGAVNLISHHPVVRFWVLSPNRQPRKQVPAPEKTLKRGPPLLQYPVASPNVVLNGTPGISNARVLNSAAVFGTFPEKSPPAAAKLDVLVFFWR